MSQLDDLSEICSGIGTGELVGRHVSICGKLAAVTLREAKQLVRRHGGVLVDDNDPRLDFLVIGADELPIHEWDQVEAICQRRASRGRGRMLSDEMQNLLVATNVEVVSEMDLWERLGVIESPDDVQLYTPAMLAELVEVSVATIRSWHRRGLIVPVRMVHRLPYFDFQEVTTARRLAQLLATGASAAQIQKKLEALAKFVPNVDRPLAQLSVIVEGSQILLREGEGLIDPSGQLRFDFEALESGDISATVPMDWRDELDSANPEQLVDLAMALEEEGQLEDACELYRAALAAGGPDAEVCFQLAENLYRTGHVEAAAERYYMAIELDEDYVEARANLGCVLAELGNLELAAAAFEGALLHHNDYPDVHFHLARVLDELLEPAEAEHHWREFLRLMPDSPWAEEARARLAPRPPLGEVGRLSQS